MNFALATLLVVQVASQTGVGSVIGQVRDRDGGALPGATVTLQASSLPTPRTSLTDASGQFLVTNIPAGQYELTISLAGFKTSSGRLQVRANERTVANARLQLGDVTDSVNVRAPQIAVAPPPLPPPGSVVRAPVRIGGDIQRPKLLSRAEPVYPDEAVAAGIEGTVVIEAIVGRNGAVRDARISKSVPMLDEAALAAVRQWTYSPTLLNGVPVDLAITVNISFAR